MEGKGRADERKVPFSLSLARRGVYACDRDRHSCSTQLLMLSIRKSAYQKVTLVYNGRTTTLRSPTESAASCAVLQQRIRR
eukprot:53383-Eustigmatos_ZCMA.PRE.1